LQADPHYLWFTVIVSLLLMVIFYKFTNKLGTSKPTTTGENEIILQRGTKFRITKAEYTNGKWYIDMEVLEQSPKEIKEMVTTSMGFYCKY
jgi:hypothetical protein